MNFKESRLPSIMWLGVTQSGEEQDRTKRSAALGKRKLTVTPFGAFYLLNSSLGGTLTPGTHYRLRAAQAPQSPETTP